MDFKKLGTVMHHLGLSAAVDLTQLKREFPSESACVRFLAQKKWSGLPVCDKCGAVDTHWKVQRPRLWKCKNCKLQFSVTKGTPFEQTRVSLHTWFTAIYLIANSPEKVTVAKVGQLMDISYKTAWAMRHRIHQLLSQDDYWFSEIVKATRKDRHAQLPEFLKVPDGPRAREAD